MYDIKVSRELKDPSALLSLSWYFDVIHDRKIWNATRDVCNTFTLFVVNFCNKYICLYLHLLVFYIVEKWVGLG